MPKKTEIDHYSDKEALDFHINGKSGKIEINSSKPLTTKRDLSLAYSPGVAAPVKEIAKNPDLAYDYTSKGNLVAVISNGSAILGLGNLGALASKPVMEGKSVLFKRFADIDSIDIEINNNNPDAIIETIKNIGGTFGGINLEDIAAPDCFIIEQKLKELLDIPIFHDDQHGTAIITTAALINALDISKKKLIKLKLLLMELEHQHKLVQIYLKVLELKDENIIMCDSKGVIYKGRKNIDQFKSAFAIDTKLRTLDEAMDGADVFLGLSAKDVVSKEMIKSMSKNPIIFACANPDPEIKPELIKEVRSDAIIATGRSDYPNQVNNLIGFPYIFRGALDVRAKEINEEMKVAAANAIALLARENVPDEVVSAYGGDRPRYGKDYIIPSTFDPRLISVIPSAVAQAAMKSGVARKKIQDLELYKDQLTNRLDPTMSLMQGINAKVRKNPKRVIFAEGEDENMLKAAIEFGRNKLGTPILIGAEKRIKEQLKNIGLDENYKIEIVNSTDKEKREKYVKHLYKKLQREGQLERDVDRLVRNERIAWGASMIACKDADAMVTGNIRHYAASIEKLKKVTDPRPGEEIFGMTMITLKGKTILVADTNVQDFPSPERLVKVSKSCVRVARLFGFDPKVAFLSHSTFGKPISKNTKHVRDAIELLKKEKVDFDFDGEMQPDVALNPIYQDVYPFSKIVGNANILIMPALHSAAISTKLMKVFGGGKLIGPLLIGLGSPIEVAPLRASTSEILNLASIAAYSSDVIDYSS